MRRGETARAFDEVRTMADIYRWFLLYLRQMTAKAATEVDPSDPTLEVSGGTWHRVSCTLVLFFFLGVALDLVRVPLLVLLQHGVRSLRLQACDSKRLAHSGRPLITQDMREAAASSIALCEEGLAKVRRRRQQTPHLPARSQPPACCA